MANIKLLATLCPSFPHYAKYSADKRLVDIRFNSAQTDTFEMDKELAILKALNPKELPIFDVKGRQLRVVTVNENPEKNLDITLNHRINVKTPTGVYFKAEADFAVLDHLEEDGRRLIFRGGPEKRVKPGESLHLLDDSLEVFPPWFSDIEKEKIAKAVAFGFKRFFLSYVENQAYVDEFLELVGKDAEVWLKIENKAGLRYVANEFVKKPNLILVAARGDLFVEVGRPHLITDALKLIIRKDPEACVGSRVLLSVIPPPGWREQIMMTRLRKALMTVKNGVLSVDIIKEILDTKQYNRWEAQTPSCADFCEMAWLYDIGYRKMMLCDELCLKEELFEAAMNAFDAFRKMHNKIGRPSYKF